MKSFLAWGALLLSSSSLLGAETGKPALAGASELESKASALVVQLGDTKFRVRDDAARQLKQLGRHATAALREGLNNPDAEIANRCAHLLPEVMASELRERIDAFIADKDGKQQHDLPLLDRFRKLAGDDPPARKLYGAIVKSNAAFLDVCSRGPQQAAEEYALRAQQLHQRISPPALVIRAQPAVSVEPHDMAALFLAGADADTSKQIATTLKYNPISNFLWQESFQSALREGDRSNPYRKLFLSWADLQTDMASVGQTLAVIQNVNLKEGLGYAVKIMNSKDPPIWTRAQALICVGKIGGKEQLPAIESLFTDTSTITNMQWQGANISTQFNDVALAMAIHVTNQSHKDYGFDALQNQALLWVYHYHGFSTDDKRSAAFKKYDAWRESQKKK